MYDVRSGSRAGKTTAALVALALASWAFPTFAAEAEKSDERSRAEMERKLEEAQAKLEAAAREVAELSASLSDLVAPHVRGVIEHWAPRATLGVNLGPRDAKELDEGVRIVSVSPGGAAEAAGLKADDVLLEVNGRSLKREGDRSPREKLLSIMRDVKPGETVNVRYRRAGKVASVDVETRSSMDNAMARVWTSPELAFKPFESRYVAGAFGATELVALTPKLGEYFGADKGLLVVRAPSDARLKLEEGDVILDIDGRTPTSASHAMRILGSYQPGEKLKLNIMRAKKRMTIDVTIPERAWGRLQSGEGASGAGVAMFHLPPLPPAPAPRVHAYPGERII